MCHLCPQCFRTLIAFRLLTLFGELPTKQFMSQSRDWADNIILAMAPLGILTIIVSAIRVGGPQWLKAIIGRARESLADAESELMSSTSDEVYEFWNGQQIVKAKKKEQICEFVILVSEKRGKENPRASADVQSVDSRIETGKKIETVKIDDEEKKYLTKHSQ